jgi:hypothetical protein
LVSVSETASERNRDSGYLLWGSVATGNYFASSASQFVTNTTGAVLSMIEYTIRNFPSRVTSNPSIGIECRTPV